MPPTLSESAQSSNGVSAPARDFLEYEVIETPASGHVSASKFWGPPNAEQDEAWDQLIRRMRILQFVSLSDITLMLRKLSTSTRPFKS